MAPRSQNDASPLAVSSDSAPSGAMGRGSVAGGVVDPKRLRLLTPNVSIPTDRSVGKTVLYWMSRDQRVQDNWALLHARDIAVASGGRLMVVFALVPRFLEATLRQYDFMLRGLREVEAELLELRIQFKLLTCDYGQHARVFTAFCEKHKVSAIVCDMSPLRTPLAWTAEVATSVGAAGVCVVQVDAHNVVPVWQASNKQETAARTIRSKITLQYGTFLKEIPRLEAFVIVTDSKEEAADGSKDGNASAPVDWTKVEASLEIDRSVLPVADLVPGSKAALEQLQGFCSERLSIFAEKRNDPNVNALSGLSPYFHFGQISAQRCALVVKRTAADATSGKAALEKGCEAFLEESIVRRELSDNFCWYQQNYDSLDGAAGWAQETLEVHSIDKREYIYSAEELEGARTHDDLWNASQLQLVRDGKMHGFLRMYWAKKILEWSETPAAALAICIRLNDRYSVDGRDPNGYVGVMWSICGIHDMGWKERPIFGKIRFMNYAGCKRKLNIPNFVRRYSSDDGLAKDVVMKKQRLA
eukprot:TRINITY_DN24000_c0_g1_i1.p1 TRINITY_DN24000_c0_g1~~TRINITY_DN24000_c0_g1_i1.p1  ORF type:complete len:529 (-),score=97.05 TRINITY_DN24000_c0_g1_i1:159-1745(-)